MEPVLRRRQSTHKRVPVHRSCVRRRYERIQRVLCEYQQCRYRNKSESLPKGTSQLGAANQVAFDAGKESLHILSLSEPSGTGFKLLGLNFDEELTMSDAVAELVAAAGWKLRTLLRTHRFYTDADFIMLYTSHPRAKFPRVSHSCCVSRHTSDSC